MTTPKPGADADDAVLELRALADALLTLDREDPLWTKLSNELRALRSTVESQPRRDNTVDRRWEDTSVYAGRLNVVAPPMDVYLDTEAGDLPALRADVTLGARFEGPSGAVHGGIVAGMLDELLGATASRLGDPVVTGTLKLRYPGLTPLNEPLSLRAWVTEDKGRIAMARATVTVDGKVTVKAEAMFVRLKQR